jgi:hypothetical protein
MLSRSAPAGTIGYTRSSFSITYSIKWGPVMLRCKRHRFLDLFALGHPHTRDAERFGQLAEIRVEHGRGLVALLIEELLPLAHHTQETVVEDGDIHIGTFSCGGRQFAHRHLESRRRPQRPTLLRQAWPNLAPMAAGRPKPIVPRPPLVSMVAGAGAGNTALPASGAGPHRSPSSPRHR